MKKTWLGLAVAGVLFFGLPAQAAAPLRVGITNTGLPFVHLDQEGHPSGFDIDLWQQLATDQSINFTYVPYPSFTALLNAVSNHQVDIAISSISTSADRATHMEFSYPYYVTRQAIMLRTHGQADFGTLLRVFKSPIVWQMFVIILCSLIFFGHIIWLLERGRAQIARRYRQGILDSIWCAFSIKTTIGLGDIIPKSWVTRIIAFFIWMSGVVFVSVLSAQLVTEFFNAVNNYDDGLINVEDLTDKVVAVERHSTGELAVTNLPLERLVLVDNIDEAYPQLIKGDIDAIVYDAPYLQWQVHLLNREQPLVTVSETNLYEDYYAVAISSEYARRQPDFLTTLNTWIISAHDHHQISDLVKKWIN